MSTENITLASELSSEEKAAFRSFLQRAEVRLSTMHRIAGVFLNGAGLLFLFPVFLRDAFILILNLIIEETSDTEQLLMLIMLFITLGVPLWAFYLLIKDIMNFYFTAYHAGVRESFFHPRFILSGITFSRDESEEAKREVIAAQQGTDMLRFIVPRDDKDRSYYRAIFNETNGRIIPKPKREFLPDDDDEKREEIEYAYTAFGLTATTDRLLVEEVAKMELSLVRHALNLRHLVLRYTKALLIFLLTTLILLIIAAPLTKNHDTSIYGMNTNQSLATMFLTWAFLTPLVVTRPITWIYRSAEKSLRKIRGDRQLVFFERVVIALAIVVFWIAAWLVDGYDKIDPQETFSINFVVCFTFTAFWLARTFRPDFNRPSRRNSNNDHDKKAETKNLSKTLDAVEPIARCPDHGYDLPRVYHAIHEHFSDSEFDTLCSDLDVPYEDFGVFGKSARARELVFYMERRCMIPDLIAKLKVERPRVNWDSLVSHRS